MTFHSTRLQRGKRAFRNLYVYDNRLLALTGSLQKLPLQ
ncbi:hypothetical protein BH10PSE7_BH10PSE7_04940 [soil metagenome]